MTLDLSGRLGRATSRSFLKLRGPDAERFLQGMITLDVRKASQAASSHGIAAGGRGFLLDAKGKAIAEVVLLSLTDGGFLLSVPASLGDRVFAALDAYLIADDVTIERLEPAPYEKVLRVPESSRDPPPKALEPTVPGARDLVSVAAVERWGLRLARGEFGPRDEEWWITDASVSLASARLASEAEWDALRVERGVAEWERDFGPDSLILEFPLYDAVSFHKGCYIGQEVIARATYRGRMTRGLARFRGASLQEGYVYEASDLEKPVGKLTTIARRQALGLVRLAVADAKTPLAQKAPDGSPILVDSVEILLGAWGA